MAASRLLRLDQVQQFAAINVLSDPGAIGGPIIIPSCAQIRLHWVLDSGKTGFNILYGRYTGTFAGTQTQCNSILAALNTGALWSALAPFLHTTTQLSAVSLRNVAVPNQAFVQSNGAAAPGTATGNALPAEVAAALTLRTALTGPQNRGRSFIPGFGTAALGPGNVIIAAAVSALSNWAASWINAISTGGYTLVIGQPARQAYTGVTGTQHPARTATSTTVTSVILRDNHWDTQRRRGLK